MVVMYVRCRTWLWMCVSTCAALIVWHTTSLPTVLSFSCARQSPSLLRRRLLPRTFRTSIRDTKFYRYLKAVSIDDCDDNYESKTVMKSGAAAANGDDNDLDAAADRVRESIDRYCEYWERQLLQEYREQNQLARDQRTKWSPQRLESRGLTIVYAYAEPDGEILGEKIVRIIRPDSERISGFHSNHHEKRGKKNGAWQAIFRQGDVLEMTPYNNVKPSSQSLSSFKAGRSKDRIALQPVYTRRECLVIDIGDDWMTVSVGPTWPAGLWEARKMMGGYAVRMDKSIAAMAPLHAQQDALQRLRHQGRSDPWALKRSKSSTIASFLAQCTDESSGGIFVVDDKHLPVQKTPESWAGELHRSNVLVIRNALDHVIRSSPWQPNHSQQEAIVWAIQRKVSLIQGPPGAGKTRVAAMLIATALQCKVPRVLAVAHSNGAADVLLEALLELGLPAVRAGRANSFSASVQHRSVVALAEKMPQVTKFRRSHLHDGITAGQEWELQQLLQDTQRSILQSAPVVVTSCIGTRQIADLEETFFPLLVLDEAAQCTEPSLVCALMASRAEQLIMVGDTQQLPPTVPTASKDLLQSLGTSPMARLERLSVLQYTLRVQYRMPPSLMEHPSIYTYNGLVESANRTTDIPPSGFPWPSMSVPLSFVHVGNRKGETLHQGGGRSNLEEARLVARIVRNLLEANDVKASGIVVLTPYSNQVQTIKLELEKASLLARTSNGNGNLPRQVVVGTVDSYQGKECDVVIFSAVRSNELSELGFLRDRRRLNVAITRSKRGLILVGDTKVLESCRHWQALMKFCKDRSCFIDSSSSASDIFCDRSRTSRTKEHATISGLSDAEDVLGYKETKYYGLFDS